MQSYQRSTVHITIKEDNKPVFLASWIKISKHLCKNHICIMIKSTVIQVKITFTDCFLALIQSSGNIELTKGFAFISILH